MPEISRASLNRFLRRIGVAALLALGAVGASSEPQVAAASSNTPVVLELFTSQGCSSCPPADVLFEQLARDPSLVVLSRPVTYWDRLGWKDTLARPQNTALQRAYARRGKSNSVYTPQSMVQGRYPAVGSDAATIRRQIAQARGLAAAAVTVDGDAVEIAGSGGPAEVTLLGLKANVDVPIGRGENGGRTVRYTNVVVDEVSLGSWSGRPQVFDISGKRVAGADRYAIVVRRGPTGTILGGSYVTQ